MPGNSGENLPVHEPDGQYAILLKTAFDRLRQEASTAAQGLTAQGELLEVLDGKVRFEVEREETQDPENTPDRNSQFRMMILGRRTEAYKRYQVLMYREVAPVLTRSIYFNAVARPDSSYTSSHGSNYIPPSALCRYLLVTTFEPDKSRSKLEGFTRILAKPKTD